LPINCHNFLNVGTEPVKLTPAKSGDDVIVSPKTVHFEGMKLITP